MRNILALLIGVVIAAGAISACTTMTDSTAPAINATVTAGNNSSKFVDAIIVQKYMKENGGICRESPVYLVAYGGQKCRTEHSWTEGPPQSWWPPHVQDPPPTFTVMDPDKGAIVVESLDLPINGLCEVVHVKVVPGNVYYPWSGQGTLAYEVKSRGKTDQTKAVVKACKG